MPEYGIFNDEGCVYGPCYSIKEAEDERQRLILVEGEAPDDLTVKELCPDHEEQPKDGCEGCFDVAQCEGHSGEDSDILQGVMGETVYCDGSCN